MSHLNLADPWDPCDLWEIVKGKHEFKWHQMEEMSASKRVILHSFLLETIIRGRFGPMLWPLCAPNGPHLYY